MVYSLVKPLLLGDNFRRDLRGKLLCPKGEFPYRISELLSGWLVQGQGGFKPLGFGLFPGTIAGRFPPFDYTYSRFLGCRHKKYFVPHRAAPPHLQGTGREGRNFSLAVPYPK